MLDSKHNNPPDPIDEALAKFGDAITEAENWLDGEPVSDEAQMEAVDVILKDIKAAHKAVADAEKSEAAPLHDAWKAAKARYKPTLDDLTRIKKGLTSIVGDYKAKLAAEKERAEREAQIEAAKARRLAEEAARKAAAGDIEAQREAAAMQEQAKVAQQAASRASSNTVKGLRTAHKYEITDGRAAINWIAKNDKEAMAAFMDDYVRRNHQRVSIDGVRSWSEKEAF